MSFSALEISALYTFGSPRVFSPEAAAYVRDRLLPGRIFRHARSGDLVTAIPHRHLVLPDGDKREIYAHVGEAVWIDEAGEVTLGREVWDSVRPFLSALREGLAQGRAAADDIERHRLAPYQTAVYQQLYRDPEPRPGGWSPAVALACARALRILYEGADSSIFEMLGFENARLVKTRGRVQALVAVPVTPPERSYGIVALRGVDLTSLPEDDDWRRNLGEWMAGLEIDLEVWHPDAPGRTHGRWLREVMRLERPIDKVIARVCGGLPLVATGHGKGAGLATLWAARRCQDARAHPVAADDEAAREASRRRPRGRAAAASVRSHGRWPWARRPRTAPAPPWRDRQGPFRYLTYEEIGTKIRQLRESQGLTQADLAARVGHEQSNISRIENGEYRVHLETLFTLLAELDVSFGEFFELPQQEAFPPILIQMLEDYRELPEDDRGAVDNLLAFKLTEKRRVRRKRRYRRQRPPD